MKAIHSISGRVAIALVGVVAALAIWQWVPLSPIANLAQVSSWLAPYRHAWYGLPVVVTVFILLGLTLVPVLLLVAATGVAFGPWLGPAYAMAGCLASASAGFGLGRLVGRRRVERLGGARIVRISRTLERNGTLAIFLLRKIPAPFLFANIVAGASHVRYRDFVLGTLLGMGAFVLALAGFSYQLTQALQHPTAGAVTFLIALLAFPFTIAWFVNRALRQRHHHEIHDHSARA